MIAVASAARRARVLRDGDAAEVGVAEEGLQRDGGRDLAGTDQLRGDVEDAPVHLFGKMLGAQEIGDAVVGIVVDQDGAEQRLLRLDVVRRDAEAGIGLVHLSGERRRAPARVIHQGHAGRFFTGLCGTVRVRTAVRTAVFAREAGAGEG